MSKMLSFKGTKCKDSKKKSLKETEGTEDILEKTPTKPYLPPSPPQSPPLYTVIDTVKDTVKDTEIDKDTYTYTPPHLYSKQQKEYSVIAPKLLSEIMTINSGRNNDVMNITSTIDLVFEKYTGNLKEITTIINDDIETGYFPQKFNIPIPEAIKWLNKKHIMLYSRKTIGTLLIIDSKQIIDDYPDCISCILFEKVNITDNFDIKVILNLKYEDRYITKSELLDVIFTNMNNFWIIIRQDDGIHLLYYYKTKEDVLHSDNSSKYSYTEFIIDEYTFICSMWSIHDLSPDVIYMVIHDQFKNVSIHQYTIRIDENDIPNIELYAVDSRLTGCGKYLSFCANYNISIFSILLELDNNEKQFYTAILALSQLDANKRTQVKLEFSKTVLNNNISNDEAQLMIYNIMTKTEESINLQDKKNHEYNLIEKRKVLAKKELEHAKKELERRDKEAKAIADKLLEEEELETLKKKKIQLKNNKDKQRLEKEKLEKAQREKERIECERLEKERFEKAELEKERLEKAQLEKERLEKEQLIKYNLEQELLKKEKERLKTKNLSKVSRNKVIDIVTKEHQPIKHKKITLKHNKNGNVKVDFKRVDDNESVNMPVIEEVNEPVIEEVKESMNEPLNEPVIDPVIEDVIEPVIEDVKSVEVQNEVKEDVKEPVIEEVKEPVIEEVKEEVVEDIKCSEKKIDTEIVNANITITEKQLDTYNTISVDKPFYYSSNEIEFNNSSYSIYFMFIHNMSMINPMVANALAFSQSSNQFNELLFINRFYVMYALDMLVINSKAIYDLKSIIDSQKEKDYPISAIYGSYLPIIYVILLSQIGYEYNPFGKKKESCFNPLTKLKDCDTLVLKLLDDYNETHTDSEFMREPSFLIGYNTHNKPVTRTKIKSSSIHNLICKCWDLNYTSAILLFEENKQPYIKRNPDFTEFLFGQQPIQLLYGKNESNLYDYTITMNRLKKAIHMWY